MTADHASERPTAGTQDQRAVLPQGLRRLWGMEDASRPGQKPSLDVRRIARAAIDLADQGGLETVSMGRVAEALGVTTMALYRYVDSKQELLELMMEVAAGDPPPLDPDLEWRDALRQWAENLAALYRQHAWWADVPLPGPPRGPHQLAWAELGMATLRDTELTAGERIDVVMLVLVYVRGAAALERQMARGMGHAGANQAQVDREFAALARSLDPNRFPQLVAAWHESEEEGSDTSGMSDASGSFTDPSFGLERILDGIELLVRRRRRREGRPQA